MERREFRRLPAEATVILRPISGGSIRQGKGKNISGGGILITSPLSYEPDQLLQIEVETTTHRAFTHVFPPMQACVRVLRVTGEKAPFEIAAEFVKDADKD